MARSHPRQPWLFAAVLAVGVIGPGLFDAAPAQQGNAPESSLSLTRLIAGCGLSGGISSNFPLQGNNQYISGYRMPDFRTTIGIGDELFATTGPIWFGVNGGTPAQNSVNARFGFGYAPTPDIGLSIGPFLGLAGSAPDNSHEYSTSASALAPRTPRLLLSGRGPMLDDAGLAASLSYMPLEDIWIGLHGSLSHDLQTDPSGRDAFGGMDAILGLTAGYRVRF